MKKNLLFFSLVTLLFIGCSKDDESAATEIQANEKFFNEAKSLDDIETPFSAKYNTDKNIERLELGPMGMFTYNYDDNKITGMDAFLQDNKNFSFSYDGAGHINSFTQNGETTTVIYDSQDESYIYEKSNGDREYIFLDADGDPKKFITYDEGNQAYYTTIVLYDSANYRGIFTNTNNPMLATCLAVPNYRVFFYTYNLTKKPIKTMIENENVSEYENTYDNQGFLETSSHTTFEGPFTYQYNYIKL